MQETTGEMRQRKRSIVSELKKNIKLCIDKKVTSKESLKANCNQDQKKGKIRKQSDSIETEQLYKSKYQIMEKLGEGTSGIVYRCKHIQSGKHYALKIAPCKAELLHQFKQLFYYVKELNHPSIIKYKALYISSHTSKTYLVMEDFDHPDLSEYELKDEAEVQMVAEKLLSAVNYLHENGICHRDIKPDNILYNPETKEIKLIDFNVSKIVKKKNFSEEMMTPTGTAHYRAPETFKGQCYSEKVDEWSVGVTLYKMITQMQPFKDQSTEQLVKHLKNHKQDNSVLYRESLWQNYSFQCKDLISKLLSPENNRISAKDALKHIWLTMHIYKGCTKEQLGRLSKKATFNQDNIQDQPSAKSTPNNKLNFSCKFTMEVDQISVKGLSKQLIKDSLLGSINTFDCSDQESVHYDSDDEDEIIKKEKNKNSGMTKKKKIHSDHYIPISPLVSDPKNQPQPQPNKNENQRKVDRSQGAIIFEIVK